MYKQQRLQTIYCSSWLHDHSKKYRQLRKPYHEYRCRDPPRRCVLHRGVHVCELCSISDGYEEQASMQNDTTCSPCVVFHSMSGCRTMMRLLIVTSSYSVCIHVSPFALPESGVEYEIQ